MIVTTNTHTFHDLTTGHFDSVPEAPAAENNLTTDKSPGGARRAKEKKERKEGRMEGRGEREGGS